MHSLIQCNTLNKKSNALLEKTLEIYKSKLPIKPYYTDDYHFGKKIANQHIALKARHIQPNSKTHIHYMLFDVDTSTSAMDWYDLNLPAPHLVVKNPKNGHSHITYILETSVKADVSGRSKPLNYFADIELGLAIKLRADLSYNATLTKNPFSSDWQTFSFESDAYDLDYLNEFVDKNLVIKYRQAQKAKEKNVGFSTSRNCQLFDGLRSWAYKNFAGENFLTELEWQASFLNSFDSPLGSSELKAIINSVYNFISRNFSIERLNELKSSRARQSALKGGGRPKIHNDEVKPWEERGIPKSWYYKTKEIVMTDTIEPVKVEAWKELGMSRRTYFRKKSQGLISGTK